MCGMEFTIYSQTSTVASLKFGNEQEISSHTLPVCAYLAMLGLK